MRAPLVLSLCLWAQTAWADVDRLIDAMGIPQLIAVFVTEGTEAGVAIDEAFLNGQGGPVWAETVARLYDAQRMEVELRAVMAEHLEPEAAAQALLFFESGMGARIIDLEVQARHAFLDDMVEEAAKSVPAAQSREVTEYLQTRDLIKRNTDAALAAQVAFLQGFSETSDEAQDAPDMDQLRAHILIDTESWLRGYSALVQSAMTGDEIDVYTAFWDTEVGAAVDDALFAAFGQSYTTLSYALGQAAGHLAPQNEL